MHKEVQDIINLLELEPHPEGGYFKETHRDRGIIPQIHLGSEFIGDRNYATAIYFLLTSETFSAFHRINQDEIWHFHQGSTIKLHMISNESNYSNVIIGNNLNEGEVPQFVVPAKFWFAAEVVNQSSYALVSCTVSPGFDFRDFVMPTREELIATFPKHSKVITQFTR